MFWSFHMMVSIRSCCTFQHLSKHTENANVTYESLHKKRDQAAQATILCINFNKFKLHVSPDTVCQEMYISNSGMLWFGDEK